MDRFRAVARLVANRKAVVPFAARGCGKEGARPVMAPLSDPNAEPGVQYIDAVDAGMHPWRLGMGVLIVASVLVPAVYVAGDAMHISNPKIRPYLNRQML